MKATTISNRSKGKLYRSLNQAEKFGVIVDQKRITDPIMENKKTKQRYLDWVFKMSLKKKFEEMILKGQINCSEVENIYCYVDEHTTATAGCYELQQSLEQEFKIGNHNFDYMTYHPPLFRGLQSVQVDYCDSSKKTLVRAADIVANKLYHEATNNEGELLCDDKFCIIKHPPMQVICKSVDRRKLHEDAENRSFAG